VGELTLVAAHMLDGTVLKGKTQDFVPQSPCFYLFPENSATSIKVDLRKAKAVFFVRDLAGDPMRADLKGFIAGPKQNAHGRKIAVRFTDTELLCGYSLAYSPAREGFFMCPADPDTNNVRVYVMASNAAEVREGAEAEALARRLLNSEAA